MSEIIKHYKTDLIGRFSSEIYNDTNIYHNSSILIIFEPIMSLTEQLENLTDYYKENRDTFNDNFRLKMHRTLSWLKKANEEASLDFKFISLWIAFNAAYADELSKEEAEHRVFHQFIIRLCELDSEHLLYGIIWDEFPSTVKALLDTPYTFQPFWDAHNGLLQGKEWKTMFAAAKKKANFAFEEQKTADILEVLFRHLYTLRNQIIHGGSTFNSQANRKQLQEACTLLSLFVPAMVKIMLCNDAEPSWGKPFYPVINQ